MSDPARTGPTDEQLKSVMHDALVSHLAQEARVTMGERILPESGAVPVEMHVLVRARVQDFLRETGWTVARLSKSCDYRKGTIQQYLTGHYTGDLDAVARDLEAAINQIRRGEQSDDPHDYIRWDIAKNMLGMLDFAQRTHSMILISGDGGRGKSVVARAAAAGEIKGSHLITAKKTHRSPKDLARLIASALRVKIKAAATAAVILEAICERLTGSIGLLMIDEAHLLSPAGLDMLRDIHKETGVGIALIGNKDIKELISDYDDEHGQMHSLFSRTYNILDQQSDRGGGRGGGGELIHTTEDVIKFARKHKLRLSDSAAKWLCALVCAPSMGGWRSARWALIAADAVREAVNKKKGIASTEITLEHIRHGWGQVRDLATSAAYTPRIEEVIARVKAA